RRARRSRHPGSRTTRSCAHGSRRPGDVPDCGTRLRAFLGRRWQGSQASGARDSARGTAKRRERRIAPPAASADGGGRLRRPGADGGEERAVTRTFGTYGGRFVPETLIPALDELEAAWTRLRDDDGFRSELHGLLTTYAGRPTPLTRADRFAPDRRIYLKREDLLHTGAHKLNNALGQAVLAQRLGKHRIVAETGAGQHGVATATVCARFGLECVVYMGSEDMRR